MKVPLEWNLPLWRGVYAYMARGFVMTVALSAVIAWTADAQSKASEKRPEPSFTLTLSAPQTQVKIDSPVKVTVLLTNQSEREITLWRENDVDQAAVYRFTVRDGDSKSPHDTTLGRQFRARYDPTVTAPNPHPRINGSPIHLKSGETLADTIEIGKLFEFTSGRFVVEVARPDPESEAIVRSNAITLTITD